jgi:hypothetical protein
LSGTISSEVVVGSPITAASPFTNCEAMAGKMVLVERGQVNFVTKVRRAETSGAVAVIVVQTVDVWPYVMTDSTGEGICLSIPSVMVSKEQGKRLQQLIVERGPLSLQLSSCEKENKCVICQDGYPRGSTVTLMPCLHAFHRECLLTWLRVRNSCPTCRYQLPTEDAAYEAQRRREGGETPSWDSWYS